MTLELAVVSMNVSMNVSLTSGFPSNSGYKLGWLVDMLIFGYYTLSLTINQLRITVACLVSLTSTRTLRVHGHY